MKGEARCRVCSTKGLLDQRREAVKYIGDEPCRYIEESIACRGNSKSNMEKYSTNLRRNKETRWLEVSGQERVLVGSKFKEVADEMPESTPGDCYGFGILI